ncbi:putative isomerase YbhE [Hypoxylon sp. FL1857]|nr:putative isomerase YbhE [Hypoxylon sp. FL1857]
MGMKGILFLVWSATTCVAAITKDIYVASYAGPVFRLALTNENGSYSLREVERTLSCGNNPGWLEFGQEADTLFCSNEATIIPNGGSIASFDKSLSIIKNVTTDYGPAQSTFYRPNRLGLAHYMGGAVSVFDTSDSSRMVELQSFHYFMDKPGPNPTLQDKPHPHGIVVDPSGNFVVVLDRGADALRTYSVGWDDRLVELGPYLTEPGNGPRHGVFVKGTSKTFFYFAGELTNSLHGFEVLYHNNGTLGFKQFYKNSTYQTWFGDYSGVVFPSEIALVGGKHLVLSTRNDSRSVYQGEKSDTIVSYDVDLETGALRLIRLTASGGLWPQSFAVSKDGKLIAVGNQYSVPGRVIVFPRDPETGVIDDGKPLANWTTNITLPDGQSISHMIWDETRGG